MKPVRTKCTDGRRVWVCGGCHGPNVQNGRIVTRHHKRCPRCGRPIDWPAKRTRPTLDAGQKDERAYQHAVAMVAQCERKLKLAVTLFDKWRKRESYYMRKREAAVAAREHAVAVAAVGKTRQITLED